MLDELGSVVAIIVSIVGSQLFIARWLDSKIDKVREASQEAHKEIREDLGKIKEKQAAHTERFNCIDQRLSDIIQDSKSRLRAVI